VQSGGWWQKYSTHRPKEYLQLCRKILSIYRNMLFLVLPYIIIMAFQYNQHTDAANQENIIFKFFKENYTS
jgi:hypothetical protein